MHNVCRDKLFLETQISLTKDVCASACKVIIQIYNQAFWGLSKNNTFSIDLKFLPFQFHSCLPFLHTEIFMVQDASVDFAETWKFLHRRMEDANTFGKASKEVHTHTHSTSHKSCRINSRCFHPIELLPLSI